jgi:hypothetical protein
LMSCEDGWRRHSAPCPRRAKLPVLSDMRSHDSVPSLATPKMVCSRSITARPNGRCGPLLWEGKTSCSSDPIAEESGPQPCTALSARPSSTNLIRSSTCEPCWRASPITPSDRSRNSCHGTWPPHSKTTLLRLHRHTHQVSTRNKWTPHDTLYLPVKMGSPYAYPSYSHRELTARHSSCITPALSLDLLL